MCQTAVDSKAGRPGHRSKIPAVFGYRRYHVYYLRCLRDEGFFSIAGKCYGANMAAPWPLLLLVHLHLPLEGATMLCSEGFPVIRDSIVQLIHIPSALP